MGLDCIVHANSEQNTAQIQKATTNQILLVPKKKSSYHVLLILKKLLAKADRDERGTETLLRSVSLLTTRPAEYLMIE